MLYAPTAIYHQWCSSGSQREQVEQSMPRRHEEWHITPAVLVETPYLRQKQLNTGVATISHTCRRSVGGEKRVATNRNAKVISPSACCCVRVWMCVSAYSNIGQ